MLASNCNIQLLLKFSCRPIIRFFIGFAYQLQLTIILTIISKSSATLIQTSDLLEKKMILSCSLHTSGKFCDKKLQKIFLFIVEITLVNGAIVIYILNAACAWNVFIVNLEFEPSG